jgi:hypothetical protein
LKQTPAGSRYREKIVQLTSCQEHNLKLPTGGFGLSRNVSTPPDEISYVVDKSIGSHHSLQTTMFDLLHRFAVVAIVDVILLCIAVCITVRPSRKTLHWCLQHATEKGEVLRFEAPVDTEASKLAELPKELCGTRLASAFVGELLIAG